MKKNKPFKRYEVYIGDFDPSVGVEIKKRRPCVIVSPSSMNDGLLSVIVAPLTSTRRYYPSRVPCVFKGVQGEIALDQMRVFDKSRLIKKIGVLPTDTAETVSETLIEMFS